MAGSPKRVCWDSCCWIALIHKEQIRDDKGKVIENRFAPARAVIEGAEKGDVEILASGLCYAEVCKQPAGTAAGEDKIAAFFEHDYIITVPVDRQVGTEARKLMMAGHAKLRPPDAVHLATAIVAKADELHTFDDRLLALDGKLMKLDGKALKICKPAHGGPVLPLLDPELVKALTEPDPATPPPQPASEGSNEPNAGDQGKSGPDVPAPSDVTVRPDGGALPGNAGPAGATEAEQPAQAATPPAQGQQVSRIPRQRIIDMEPPPESKT